MSRQMPWARVLLEGLVIVGSILLAFGVDAWWDAQNLVGRASRGEGARDIVGILEGAAGFEFRVHEHRAHATAQIRRDELERALKHFDVGKHYLRLLKKRTREEVLAAGTDQLERQVTADLLAVAPLYSAIVWSPENDYMFAGGGMGARS